jgi:nitrate reductase beta subunit
VRLALLRLAALRHFMRLQRVEQRTDTQVLDAVGLNAEEAQMIYRLLALAPLAERFVIPTAPVDDPAVFTRQGRCGLGEAF